ncbi:cell division protein FtsQ/DivIB [Patescibacteria group bacterium]
MKYYRKPYRITRKKSIFKGRFFWFGVLGLGILCLLFYFMIFASFFQVKEIQISRNQKVQTENIEGLVWKNIEKKIIFFKTKSIFLVSPKKIKEHLLEKFSKISDVEGKRKFPSTVMITITERQPLFIFCKNMCFYFDEKGIVFEDTEYDGSLPKLIDDGIQDIWLGKRIIEGELLEKLLEIEFGLKENKEISIKEIVILHDKIEVKTPEGFSIYFNKKEGIESQIQNLTLILLKEIPLQNREDLEYIDLRFGTKVYYKYILEE